MVLSDKIEAGRIVKYQTRSEWLAARVARLGASEVASLWPGEGYYSLATLWAFKAGQAEPNDADAPLWMEFGREFELPILNQIAKPPHDAYPWRRGWQVEPWPQNWVVTHPDETLRLAATPDALLIDDDGRVCVGQVKSVSEFMRKRWPRDDDGELAIPAHMEIQTQAELDCVGLERGYLIVLFGKSHIEVIQYERHEKFIGAMRRRILDFWDMVDSGEMPEIDGSESTYETLRNMFPSEDGTAVELPADADFWAADLAEAKQTISDAEKKRDLAKNKLIAAIGSATWAQTPGGIAFSFKEQTRAGVDRKALAKSYPEAARACATESRFRVLRELKELPADAADQLI